MARPSRRPGTSIWEAVFYGPLMTTRSGHSAAADGAAPPLAGLIRDKLAEAADPAVAPAMQAYMKSAMPFRGVTRPTRDRLLHKCLAERPVADAAELATVADALWDNARFREERYLATALVRIRRHAAWPDPGWLPRYGRWIVTGAWWDHVDEIASRLVGPLLRAHAGEVTPVVREWAHDPDPWLRRSAIICQLQAKDATDLRLLAEAIEASIDDPDFFLRKGIGWALRQHARADPGWVLAFVDAHPRLSALSRREALRHF